MFVTTSGRSGAPKAWRTATYDGTIIHNDPVYLYNNQNICSVILQLHITGRPEQLGE
jgi:hypothetical protein